MPTEQGHILPQNKAPKYKVIKTWLMPSFPLLVGWLVWYPPKRRSAVFIKVNLKSWDLRRQSSVHCSASLSLRLWASLPSLCFAPQLQNGGLSCSSFLNEFYFTAFYEYWNVPLWAIYSHFCLLQDGPIFPGSYSDFPQQWTWSCYLSFSPIPMSSQVMANTINCRFNCYRDAYVT